MIKLNNEKCGQVSNESQSNNFNDNHHDPTLIELWWLKLRGLGLIDKYIASIRQEGTNKIN